MLQGSILQYMYFRPSLSYHLSLRSLFCLFWVAVLHRFYCTIQYVILLCRTKIRLSKWRPLLAYIYIFEAFFLMNLLILEPFIVSWMTQIWLTVAKFTCPCNTLWTSSSFARSDTGVVIDSEPHPSRTWKISLLFAPLAVRVHAGCFFLHSDKTVNTISY